MKVALAQINTIIGDFPGNIAKIRRATDEAKGKGASLIVFPELSLPGYPPGDLLLGGAFVSDQLAALDQLAGTLSGITAVVGFVDTNKSGRGKPLHNSAAVIQDGRIVARYAKMLLPTYDVFDEARYFEPGTQPVMFTVEDSTFGLTICEDLWTEPGFDGAQLYTRNPVAEARALGAQAILNLSASPFHLGKETVRERLAQAVARRHECTVFYTNLVGGNDSLIFDGGSLAVNTAGSLGAQSPVFKEDLLLVDWQEEALSGHKSSPSMTPAAQAHQALVLGLRDYLKKCGFQKAIVGLSGGIDSAVVACLAAEAVGKENVWGIAMPGPYTAEESTRDAQVLAKNLGIRFDILPIAGIMKAFSDTLNPVFTKTPSGIAEENLQARIRGVLLMALSNKFGHLLLSTGNKSEMAVGYCTLYGDMNGGLAAISDVPKTLVYEIAREINKSAELIPQNTIIRAPTAELRPNQKDSDSLPEYAVLDPILAAYVERNLDAQEIARATGAPVETVTDIVARVDRAEYKRRQAPPGLRISAKAFGVGRRLPIAQHYLQGKKP